MFELALDDKGQKLDNTARVRELSGDVRVLQTRKLWSRMEERPRAAQSGPERFSNGNWFLIMGLGGSQCDSG